jgi:RimJ/RimL family protein N-acetyltransferase
MTRERYVTIGGKRFPVVISDDDAALLRAEQAGETAIGILREGSGGPGLDGCLYLVTDPADVTERLLERAVRRTLGLPWIIAETRRLTIREFAPGDPLEEPSPYDCGGVFSSADLRNAYVRNQYRFAETGLWALVRRRSGALIGKAGITGGELGYHIYRPYRGQGYALEACRAILAYAARETDLTRITLRAAPENSASLRLAEKLGFARAGAPGGNFTNSDCIHFVYPL